MSNKKKKHYKLRNVIEHKGDADMSNAIIYEKTIFDNFNKNTKDNSLNVTQNPINKYIDAFKALSLDEVKMLNDMIEDND